jgi:hypothetical protein
LPAEVPGPIRVISSFSAAVVIFNSPTDERGTALARPHVLYTNLSS